MIDSLVTVVENSTLVEMPVRSINSDSQWSSDNHLFDLFAARCFSNSKNSIRTAIDSAGLINSLVRICLGVGLAMIFDPLESTNSVSSIAAVVSIIVLSRAVNKLLLA